MRLARSIVSAVVLVTTLTAWAPLNEHPNGRPYTWQCGQVITVRVSSATDEEAAFVRYLLPEMTRRTGLTFAYGGATRLSTVDAQDRVVLRRNRWTLPGLGTQQIVVGFEDAIAGIAGTAEPLADLSYYRSAYARIDSGDIAAFSNSPAKRGEYRAYLILHELAHAVGADHHERLTSTEVLGLTDEAKRNRTVPTAYGREDRRALTALGC